MKIRLFTFLLFLFFLIGCDDSTSGSGNAVSENPSTVVNPDSSIGSNDSSITNREMQPEEASSDSGEGKKSSSSKITPPSGFNPDAFLYNLKKPTAKYKLDTELKEISALSFVSEGQLAVIQDEKGKVYLFGEKEKDIIKEKKFEKKGDFEGIEIIGNTAFVLRSDGRLYKVEDYLSEDPKIEKYKTGLAPKNDTEGLGFDPVTGNLLIACKSSPNLGDTDAYKSHRAIYAFDIKSNQLQQKPFLLISLDTLNNHIKEGQLTTFSKEIIKTFKGDITFQPSGVAVHPITKKIYVIASVGKLLVIANRDGTLEAILSLDKDVFKHPEGITFAPNGDLYISNEGNNGKGNILRFNYQNQ
ncbi:SdiA-regulated domain-containing protein [bacterium]|nr:SdiA-regulated domain-containing protein [bacterium]